MDSGHTTRSVRAVSGEPFGVVLRRLRARAGLTQEELAERAELSANAVSALERGVRNRPHRHTRDALATALGVIPAERASWDAAVAPRLPRARCRSRPRRCWAADRTSRR